MTSCGGGSGGASLQADFTNLDGGDYTISGRVTLPANVSGKVGQIFVKRSSGDFSASALEAKTLSGSEISYSAVGLIAGTYTIRLSVDRNENGIIDSGDYVGFCCGTSAAPILDESEAEVISVESSNVSGKDFYASEQ